MLPEIPIIPGRGLSTLTAKALRLAYLREKGLDLGSIPESQLDIKSIQHNIESFIGSVEIPLGVVGPIVFNHNGQQEQVYAAAGTLEGALIASMNRGARVIAKSGGFTAEVAWQRMVRSPMLLLEEAEHAAAITAWIHKHFEAIKKQAEAYSNHAKLLQIDTHVLGAMLNLNFVYETGDASGQNMTTTCTWHALLYLAESLRKDLPHCGFDFIIEGNGAADKKISTYNISAGRGIRVTARCELPRQVIQEVLRTTPETMLRYFKPSRQQAEKQGMLGYNINVANTIAAFFVATGQDLASIHEASTAFLDIEAVGNDRHPEALRFSLTLPNLVIGTVGGGTHLAKQAAALQMMGCLGSGKVFRFAQLIAGFALGLEISTFSAITSGEFAKAHEKLGRNKPVSWLLKAEITPAFLAPQLQPLLGQNHITALHWREDASLENGIITNLTGKISNKIIGFLPLELQLQQGEQLRVLIKSKALDTEVIKGLHLLSASIDTQLADLLKQHQNQLEYHGCHLKELAVSQHLHAEGFAAMPRYYGQYQQPEREIYLLFQEWIGADEILLRNAENHPEKWTSADIQACLQAMADAHHCLETLQAEPLGRLPQFEPWKALPLYQKLMAILLAEGGAAPQQEALRDFQAAMRNFEANYQELAWPCSPIHNDFNPRNILLRSNGEVCIYDWELCVCDLPQRDLLEFLSFVRPEDLDAATLLPYLEWHYQSIVKRQGPGHQCTFDAYLQACELAIKTYICCRISFYEVSGIVAKYDFSKRILTVALRMQEIIKQARLTTKLSA